MDAQPESRRLQAFAWYPALALAGAKFLLHALTLERYGWFRDELYFLDCAKHPQWGYVDDAPGIVWAFRAALALGGSLGAVRAIAALGGALTVLTGPLLARELGGGRFAQAFAGLCILAAPVFLGMDSILCVGAIEPLAWMGCVLLLARIARTGDARLWIPFGLVAGLGIHVKYTMLLVLACMLGALVLDPLRRQALRGWFWAGALLAVAVALPTLLWQVRNDFPLLRDMAEIRRIGKNVELAPPAFLLRQILVLNPLLFPVWAGGLVWLLRRKGPRILGVSWLLLLGAMMALKAKDYYLAASYPVLFAAGACGLEALLEGRPRLRAAVLVPPLATLALLAPLILPLLPPDALLAYQARLGLAPTRTERSHDSPLDQRLADQFGWEEMAREVARVYHALPEGDRARAGIYAENYGEAGAINLYGPALGLPPAICAHQAHSLWGPPAKEPEILILVGSDGEGLDRIFSSFEAAGRHAHPWGMAYENRPIWVCRGWKTSLRALWPRITHWD